MRTETAVETRKGVIQMEDHFGVAEGECPSCHAGAQEECRRWCEDLD